jgi:hypothetical protein
VALLSLSLLAAADIGTPLGEPRRIRRTVAGQTAGLLQTRLNDMKRAVESTARNPRLPDLLARGDQSQLQALIESEGARHVDLDGTFPFDTLLLVDSRNGAFVARWPKMDPDSEGQDFRARDYYEGLASSTVAGCVCVTRLSSGHRRALQVWRIGTRVPQRADHRDRRGHGDHRRKDGTCGSGERIVCGPRCWR